MTIADILRQRLQNQWLVDTKAQSPPQVVRQLLATQAQDYLGSLWAIGQRMNGADETSVEQAVTDGSIVRTWPMRGTLHFVAAEDVKWLSDFLAPRVLPKTRSIHLNAGLDAAVFKKSERVIVKALEKEPMLTRDALYERLEKNGIATANSRGLHITGYLAVNGLICLGPRNGKQHTFVMRDEWLRNVKHLQPDDTLSTLALRYFAGHGPATVQDFAWWTGLSLTESREAIARAGSGLVESKLKDYTYYQTQTSSSNTGSASAKLKATHLLPAFDEFTVAYKERTLMLPSGQQHRSAMEVLSPGISINGLLVGAWSRTLTKKGVELQLKPFTKLTDAQRSKISAQAKRYARFVGAGKAILQ